MAFWPEEGPVKVAPFGAVTMRMPSELKLDMTLSGSQSAGRVHLRENWRMTLDEHADLSSLSLLSSACLPSMLNTLLTTVTLSSSGLYWGTSSVTSNLSEVSFNLITWRSKRSFFSKEEEKQTSSEMKLHFVGRSQSFATFRMTRYFCYNHRIFDQIHIREVVCGLFSIST